MVWEKSKLEGAVFSGLTEKPDQISVRTATLVALLVGHLHAKGHITEPEIGALMVEVLR
jgi:hypothetical protein